MINLEVDAKKRLVAVHGWSSVILGFLLYVVVLTGTVAVLHDEIGRWAMGGAAADLPLAHGVEENLQKLLPSVDSEFHDEILISATQHGHQNFWFHTHVPDETGIVADYGRMVEVHPISGEIMLNREGYAEELFGTDAASALDAFLLELHIRLHLPDPWGVYITGILGFLLLLAAATGLFVHKHLLKDIFVSPRFSSALLNKRDRHILAGSWALPFAFVLAFTGAFYSFAIALGFPVVTNTAFGGDRMEMVRTIIGAPVAPDESPAPRVNFDDIIVASHERTNSVPSALAVQGFGTAGSEILVSYPHHEGSLEQIQGVYSGVSGEYLRDKTIFGPEPSAGSLGFALMSSLHFGHFGGLLSKLAWVGLGLATCYASVSGLRLWFQRRSESVAWRRFDAATTVVVYGLPLALIGSAIAFFASVHEGTSQYWTAAGFLGSCAAAIIAGFVWCDHPKLQKGFVLALSLGMAVTPAMRLLTVGGGWGFDSQRFDGTAMLLDALLLIGAIIAARSYLNMRLPRLGQSDSFETVLSE